MENDSRNAFAAEIMHRFADDTGLTGTAKPRRYLWTDAFAVCNFLELHLRTGEEDYRNLALRLVDQVHQVLGRHRGDDPRSGWISGLDEDEGSAHPTAGGLRIGKPVPERRPDEPFDERLEWKRDGQYFHYLTKWMHALHLVAMKTGQTVFDGWALELARAAHAGFTYHPSSGGPKRMYWKMSIDLSRPLVPAMGHHDPLDGYITYLELQRGAPTELEGEIIDMKAMCRGRDWSTDDPLGLGGILADALRVARLMVSRTRVLQGLLEDLLAAAAGGLERYRRQQPQRHPAEYRLAFRELGLSIGLHGLAGITRFVRENPEIFDGAALENPLTELAGHMDLGRMIEEFWLSAENRRAASWTSHQDINMVMLATSLVPEGFLNA